MSAGVKQRNSKGHFIKGHVGFKPWLGKKMSEDHRNKLSIAHIGQKPTNLPQLLKMNTGIKFSEERRRKISVALSGSKNIWWKGGVTPLRQGIHNSFEYKEWRRRVFERDDYTCQMCGVKGGQLNADHIKSFSQHPELRFELSNGRTLCVSCHRRTPNFGGRANVRRS